MRLNLSTDHNDYILIWDLTNGDLVQAIPQVSILKAFLEQHCATGNIALMLDDGEVRVETQGDGWNYCETNVNIIMSNGMSHHGYGAVYSQDRIVGAEACVAMGIVKIISRLADVTIDTQLPDTLAALAASYHASHPTSRRAPPTTRPGISRFGNPAYVQYTRNRAVNVSSDSTNSAGSFNSVRLRGFQGLPAPAPSTSPIRTNLDNSAPLGIAANLMETALDPAISAQGASAAVSPFNAPALPPTSLGPAPPNATPGPSGQTWSAVLPEPADAQQAARSKPKSGGSNLLTSMARKKRHSSTFQGA